MLWLKSILPTLQRKNVLNKKKCMETKYDDEEGDIVVDELLYKTRKIHITMITSIFSN